MLITLTGLTVYSQTALKFEKSFPINEKQKKLYKMAQTWTEQQPNLQIKTLNDVDIIAASGFFNYENHVEYKESKTISRSYAEQTKGSVIFEIKMTIKDNELTVVVENFKHNPKNDIDKIDFGAITSADKAPDYLYLEYDEEYCNNVWNEIKLLVKEQTEVLLTGIPENLVTVK
jgi:hypothetical protein